VIRCSRIKLSSNLTHLEGESKRGDHHRQTLCQDYDGEKRASFLGGTEEGKKVKKSEKGEKEDFLEIYLFASLEWGKTILTKLFAK
jgi:hypothetical protein